MKRSDKRLSELGANWSITKILNKEMTSGDRNFEGHGKRMSNRQNHFPQVAAYAYHFDFIGVPNAKILAKTGLMNYLNFLEIVCIEF